MKSVFFFLHLIFFNKLVSSLKLADSKANSFILDESLVYERVIQFRNSTPHKKDEYRCVYSKLNTNTREYISKNKITYKFNEKLLKSIKNS